MEEQNNRSSEPQKEPVNQSSKPSNMEEVDDCKEKIKKTDEQRQLSSNTSSDCRAENVSAGKRGESKTSQPEVLTSVPLPENGSQFEESSRLSEVPVEYSLQPLQSVEELKDQVRAISAEPVNCITCQPTQVQVQHQLQVPDGPSRLGLPPTSVTQSLSSVTSTTLSEQKSQTVINGNKPCLAEEDKQNSPSPKPLHAVPTLKTPSDGYNWRKYGQKQVKNPEGSRSYFRCTFSECCAKKIECCDPSNRVIETVYRSHHNHEPPEKLNSSRETRPALKGVPVHGSSDTIRPVRGLNDLVPHIYSKEHLKELDQTLETKRQKSNDSDETLETNVKEEYIDGPEYKKRQKRSSTCELGSIPKPGNKPKFVIHAAGDVGISGDGYRWRKYGQKMVKGNCHPRNYYRCTSAGCPVRKHIERALDNTGAVLITYKGGHDHDMPVPKKRHGPKNAPLVSATSPLMDKLQINKTDAHHSQTQYSVYKENESSGGALSLEGNKTSESTRTLLSIGFEIKPCSNN